MAQNQWSDFVGWRSSGLKRRFRLLPALRSQRTEPWVLRLFRTGAARSCKVSRGAQLLVKGRFGVHPRIRVVHCAALLERSSEKAPDIGANWFDFCGDTVVSKRCKRHGIRPISWVGSSDVYRAVWASAAANILLMSPEVTGRSGSRSGAAPPMPQAGSMLTCLACAFNAPTVQFSRPRMAKGS